MNLRNIAGRIIVAILLFAVMTPFMAETAFAATNVTISGDDEVAAGSEFTVQIEFSGDNVAGVEGQIGFDSSRLEYVSGGDDGGEGYVILNKDGGDGSVVFDVTFKAIKGGNTGLDVSSGEIIDTNKNPLENCAVTKIVHITGGAAGADESVVQEEKAPEPTAEDLASGNGVYLILIIGGTIVLAAIIIIIVVLRKKRKRALSLTVALVMAATAFAAAPGSLDSSWGAVTLKAKTTDSVNVRSGASATSTKVTLFEKGKTFTVTGAVKGSDGAYWYKLKYNSKACYLKGKYAVRTGLSTTGISKTTGTVTANDINLRLGPGTDYYVVGRAKKGETYNVNGTAKDSSGNTWYRIYGSDGFKLYISGTYLKLGSTASSGTSSAASASAASAATQAAASVTTASGTMPGVTTAAVNVRKGAGTDKSKKGTLSKGKSVTITGLAKASNGTYWYIIKYKSGKGYVSAAYVSRQGYSSKAIAKQTGTVTNSGVNLRLGPGTDFPKYIKAKNKKYTVNGVATDGSGYVWYRVRVGGRINLYMGSNNISVPNSVTTEDSTPQVDLNQESTGNTSSGTVSASGVTYPSTLATGTKFTLKGTLTSSTAMTAVQTGITDSSGKWLTGYKVSSKPNSTTYDINKNVDDAIKFGNLGAGTYHYICIATTSQGTSTVFNYTFTVKDMATISISGLSYPKVHNQYKSFTLKGTIACSLTMTKLVVGIMKSNGTWLSGHYVTVKPNSRTYSLTKVDSSIKFGDLATGSYIYRCYVTTATGQQIAFSYSFTVNTNTGIPAALSYGTLSGNKRNDMVQVAMAQVGYNTAKENHTVYNLWYYGSDTSAAWCAIFVSWCANQCGVSTGVIPKMAYVPSITSWYRNKGKFNAKKTLPKKGDLIIYAGSAHIGIVAEDVTSTSGKVSTIEGNTGDDEVKYRKNYMKWNSSAILGYCSPAY